MIVEVILVRAVVILPMDEAAESPIGSLPLKVLSDPRSEILLRRNDNGRSSESLSGANAGGEIEINVLDEVNATAEVG